MKLHPEPLLPHLSQTVQTVQTCEAICVRFNAVKAQSTAHCKTVQTYDGARRLHLNRQVAHKQSELEGLQQAEGPGSPLAQHAEGMHA